MNNRQDLINSLRTKKSPIKVYLKRGSSIESKHIAHAVVCDLKGRVLMFAGDPEYVTFIRSSLKPFQVLPFISSGTSEYINTGDKGLAIACGSHSGSVKHAREAYKLLWNSEIDISTMKCPIPQNRTSKLEHNCSGKHAAFLATCKKMNWPLENYLNINHPLQKEITRRIAEILEMPSDELITATDDCGSPTYLLQLNQMARLYANLSGSNYSELEQINRAMVRNPFLIAGEERFDTELMNRAHGQIISKGGSEGIQCLGRSREGLGIAIKIEDGSKRAKHAVAIHLLKQLEWITPTGLKELEEKILKYRSGVNLEVEGGLGFQEN